MTKENVYSDREEKSGNDLKPSKWNQNDGSYGQNIRGSDSARAQRELIKMQETKCYSASFSHQEQMK